MQNYNNEPRRGLLTGRRLAASVRSPRKVRRSHGSRTSAYTPFGVPGGNAALAKRFMFSSEEWFPARSTLNYGLILYLYRAYSPALARFLTRDPINEQGGVNLYNFVGNNPVTRWDDLGMWDSLIHQRQTAIWAENNRYPRMVAQEIAESLKVPVPG